MLPACLPACTALRCFQDDYESGQLPPEVVQALQNLSKYIVRNRTHVKTVFDQFDKDKNGRLDAQELLRMFTSVIPGLSTQQLRHMVMQVGERLLGWAVWWLVQPVSWSVG